MIYYSVCGYLSISFDVADGNLKRQYQDQITQHKLEISGYDDGITKMKVEGKEIENESKEIEQKIVSGEFCSR